MKVYHFTKIVEITEKGLFYKDEQEAVQFIEFLKCKQNWKKQKSMGVPIDRNNVKNLVMNTEQCVGERNWQHLPPFIEFFMDEHIQFIFPNERQLFIKKKNLNYKYFRAIMMRLNEKGMTLFDLG